MFLSKLYLNIFKYKNSFESFVSDLRGKTFSLSTLIIMLAVQIFVGTPYPVEEIPVC